MKKAVFYSAMLLPLLSIPVVGLYFLFFTNLPQLLYLFSIRNIYFDCFEFVADDFVFKMKPGECSFKNIEYDTVLTHDADGFRNRRRITGFDVAVIGASHAHGFGVSDDQTFASLLESEHGYVTRNLGMVAYATTRELEVLSKYGKDAKYVVIQCSRNDSWENPASLTLSREEFRFQIETRWRNYVARYHEGKRQGYKKPIHDLATMLANGLFSTKSAWQRSVVARDLEPEARAFGQIIAQYRPLLEGKRLIIFESSDFGLNSPNLVATFAMELKKIDWLAYKLIDITRIVSFDDYYFLDGHPATIGHTKMAAAIAAEITRWETAAPIIGNH